MKMKNCSLLFLCSALKLLVIILSSLLIFVSCKKDKNPPSPETEALTFAEARPGDTLIIKGKNFSEVLTNNIVKFNGVEATLISASPTELKVLVPAGATSGPITITVNGVTIEAGSVTIIPFTLYTIKVNYQSSKLIEQLVSIDPANGKESVIVELTSLPKYNDLYDIEYLASTNEIVGLSRNRKNLFKINVTTKQSELVVLSTDQDDNSFTELVVDKNANLYAIKEDWSGSPRTQSLVKVDPKTGTTTEVNKAFTANIWRSLVYLGASNEVAGLVYGGDRLLKVNLTTKDTSSTPLPTSDIRFHALAADKQSNLYGIVESYIDQTQTYVYQIVKLNAGAGGPTVLSTLPQFEFHYYTAFIPQRNEIAVISQDKRLYRVNINTQASTTDDLTRDQYIFYRELTIN